MGGRGCVVGWGVEQGVGGASKHMTTMPDVAGGWVCSLLGALGVGNCIFWG